MHVSGAHTNVPMMKYKLDLLMGIYPWVQMVVFSELCARGPLTAFAAPLEEFDEVFGEMAKKHKVWLLPGSVFEKTDGKIYNTASVYNPDGKVVGRYRKMFPFYPYEEGVECGNEFLTFDVPHVGRFVPRHRKLQNVRSGCAAYGRWAGLHHHVDLYRPQA